MEKSDKIKIVEKLVEEAWTLLAAARDVVLLSESQCDDLFTWDEKDSLETLAIDSAALRCRMLNRKPKPTDC